MEIVNSRNLVWLTCAVVLALILRWVGHHFILEKDGVQDRGYTYEMPHPESEAGKFDLEGRAIDRMVLENNKMDKKGEIKKAVATPAAKTAANKVFANTATANLTRQAHLMVDSTDSSYHLGLTASMNNDEMSSGPTHVYRDLSRSGLPTNPTTPTTTPDNPTNKTAAEWKALLQTNNPKVVAEFIQAHEQGQVTDSDFYLVSMDLLLSGNQSISKTGQQILSEDTGASGFLYLAHEFQVVSNSQRQIIWTVLLTYATPGKFKELLVGLHGTGPTVSLALQVLNHAVQSAQNNVSTQSVGVGGSSTSTNSSPHGLLIFLPALNDTIKSDPADSAAAQNLYQIITSLNS